jgi:hypothetical protein
MGQPEMHAVSFANDESPCPNCGCILQKQDLIDGKFDVEPSPSGRGWVPTHKSNSWSETVRGIMAAPDSPFRFIASDDITAREAAPKAQGGSGCLVWIIAIGLPGLCGVTEFFAR